MTHSSYTDKIMLSPNCSSRDGASISRLTPHHMAGVLTGTQCANLFLATARQASATYCIGVDGDVVCSVDEVKRPWTSSSYDNDRRAITWELSNSSTGGDWPIGDKTMDKFILMAADCGKRYGIPSPLTKGGSLTWHQMFAATSCPGPWFLARLDSIIDKIAKAYGGGSVVTPPSKPSTGTMYKVQSGDSLYKIGTIFGVAWQDIAKANNIVAPWTIYKNQDLIIPGAAPSPVPTPNAPSTDWSFGGTYRCTVPCLYVRSAPSQSGAIVASYSTGQTVILDDWYTIEGGYVWGRYTGYSGATRYIAVGPHTGKAEANDYLVKQ